MWQHRGTLTGQHPGGGNHRGSVFRLHVGTALISRYGIADSGAQTWGTGSSADRQTRDNEYPIERKVSQHIRGMSFLWVGIEDEPGPDSLRGYVERNAIALLSNFSTSSRPIDPPSEGWLGHRAANEAIGRSGLWNVEHVAERHNPDFLDHLYAAIEKV